MNFSGSAECGTCEGSGTAVKKGWIGVDLDGTLAVYEGWVSEEHIGEPIPLMVERVKEWLAEGREVRIFTARVDGGLAALRLGDQRGKKFRDVERVRRIVQDWCERHIGVRLEVTNVKDYAMVALYDDRAFRVERNTGKIIGSETK